MKNLFIKIKQFFVKLIEKIKKPFKKADDSIDNFNNRIISKVSNFRSRSRFWIIMFALTALLIGVRLALIKYPSNDFLNYIQPWTIYIKNGGGLPGLRDLYQTEKNVVEIAGSMKSVPGCDYPPLYMYFLTFISFFPMNNMIGTSINNGIYYSTLMYGVKFTSFFFEIVMAIFIYKIIKKVTEDQTKAIIGYTITLFLPTIITNSALWGQCDVCYAAMVIGSIYFIMSKKPIKSMIFFGLSLAFKMQGIFILPLFGFLWFRKEFKLRYLLVALVTVIVTFLPLWFSGAKGITPFISYGSQLTEYNGTINWNSTNFYTIFNFYTNNPDVKTPQMLSTFGMIFMCLVCLLSIIVFALKKVKVTNKSILTISAYFLIIVPFFMPHMHERYFYMADVIFVAYALCHKRRVHMPILMQFSSLIGYMAYGIINTNWLLTDLRQFSPNENLKFGTIINIILIVFVIYDIVKLERDQIENQQLQEQNS